jgi:PhzF family phenazine biosynthesis protein
MIETYIVDAFTDKPFKGNPAGVCILLSDLETHQMLSIANELGLSETAFIKKYPDEDKYSIRYFSPKMEIPLCGHATLASSKVLFDRNSETEKIWFVTGQNLDLKIFKEGDKIAMEFPVYDTEPADAPASLLRALEIDTAVNVEYNAQTRILLIEIKSSEMLRNLKPDFQGLSRSHSGINGVLVTAPSSNGDYDFQSRYFWPWSGTNEDPVTGGTHTFLVKYWSKRLRKSKMKSFQCSERTGFMDVEIISEKTFTIKSNAQIIFQGKLRI